MASIRDGKWECGNCNRTFRHLFSNNLFFCTGLVKDTIRNCDVIRYCQGSEKEPEPTVEMDISLDEAAIFTSGLSMALTTYLIFGYRRPCNQCPDKECPQIDSGEEGFRWEGTD